MESRVGNLSVRRLFLDASAHLYKSVRPSIGPSVSRFFQIAEIDKSDISDKCNTCKSDKSDKSEKFLSAILS